MPYCPGGRLDNDDENWERAWLIPGTTTKFVIGIVVLSKPGLWKDLAGTVRAVAEGLDDSEPSCNARYNFNAGIRDCRHQRQLLSHILLCMR